MWSTFGLHDLSTVLRGVGSGLVLSVLAVTYLYKFERFSRSVFLIDAVLLTAAIVGDAVVVPHLRPDCGAQQPAAARASRSTAPASAARCSCARCSPTPRGTAIPSRSSTTTRQARAADRRRAGARRARAISTADHRVLRIEEVLISSPSIDAPTRGAGARGLRRARRPGRACTSISCERTLLRVGVDGRAFASPAGGVRRYVGELYPAMRGPTTDVEVVAIGATGGCAAARRRARRRGAIPSRPTSGWMAASMPLAARGARLDVYHAPAYTAPLWGVHPQVLTIHDVSYERRPEWNAYENDPVAAAVLSRARHSPPTAIVTDSGFSRTEIGAAYGIPEPRIDVVPLAAATIVYAGRFEPRLMPEPVRRPYALHVGDLHIRRNVDDGACRGTRSAPRRSANCVAVAGLRRHRPGYRAGIDPAGPGCRRPRGAHHSRAVPDSTLLNLYRGAELLVYPSRYEGFGLPILEAMQCGIPVIGARAASIPEVVGPAGGHPRRT